METFIVSFVRNARTLYRTEPIPRSTTTPRLFLRLAQGFAPASDRSVP
jgi:hypothetical protein